MTDVVDVTGGGGPRFAPDPLSPGRERWWDGWHWTARVRDGDDEGLHWTPYLADIRRPGEPEAPTLPQLFPGPIPLIEPLLARSAAEPEAPTVPQLFPGPLVLSEPLLVRAEPEPEPEPEPESEPEPVSAGEFQWVTEARPRSFAADPMVAAFGDDVRPSVPEASVPGAGRRRIATAVGVAAAAALVAAAAAAGAGVFTSTDERPQVEHALAYRDGDAEFALRYPDEWRVLRRERGSSIRFAIASPGAPASETNTVSVVVGARPADIPPLHDLADQLTEMLQKKLPDVQLDLATRMRIANAPGFRFTFRDPSSSPATSIEQYVGQTANGRPLTVTVTVREPRTAPTNAEMRDFLGSLRSGKLAARA